MKKNRMLVVVMGCITLLFAGASIVSAQVGDAIWFKIETFAKGTTIDLEDSSLGKLSLQNTGYLALRYEYPIYSAVIFSEGAPDEWQITGSLDFPPELDAGETIFLYPQTIAVLSPDGPGIYLELSGQFDLKLDKEDSLKKAVFTAQGILIKAVLGLGETMLFGKAKVKAKMIKADELPFNLYQ